MAQRNTYKIINETRKKMNRHYAMTYSDITAIYENADGPVRKICDGFIFGYAMGLRAAKKEAGK